MNNIHFPANPATLSTTFLAAGVLLMTFEMITYWSFREGIEAVKRYIIFGIPRDTDRFDIGQKLIV